MQSRRSELENGGVAGEERETESVGIRFFFLREKYRCVGNYLAGRKFGVSGMIWKNRV